MTAVLDQKRQGLSRKTREMRGKPDLTAPGQVDHFWDLKCQLMLAPLPREIQPKNPKSKELPTCNEYTHYMQELNPTRTVTSTAKASEKHRESAQAVGFCISSAYLNLNNIISIHSTVNS